ncbi:hypothetical protein KAR91_02405 [Candidatus Pacearchaeota archaeon]|nr:hypothetical protein [Candidatus Pacearchaeota archaeon]
MKEKIFTHSEKVVYIAAATRFATAETGLKDFSDFILLVSEFEMDMGSEIIGFPVYVVSGFPENNYILSYRYDCDSIRFRAMRAFKEFQELYSLGDDYE